MSHERLIGIVRIVSLLLGVSIALQSQGRSFRPDMLPNAHLVPGAENRRCVVCHVDPNPRTSRNNTDRNAFGKVVEEMVTPDGDEPFWGPALAAGDADGDGIPNGLELGDPDGLALHRRFGIPEDQNFPLLDPAPDESQLEVGNAKLVSNPGLASSVPPGTGPATPTPTPSAVPATPTPTFSETPSPVIDRDGNGKIDQVDILENLRSGLDPVGWFRLAYMWKQILQP